MAPTAQVHEAGDTYKLRGLDKHRTMVEQGHRRPYKAHVADRLDGQGRAVAETEVEAREAANR